MDFNKTILEDHRTELPILGITFQDNCKYSEHVRAKLIKANKCLFV